MQKFKAQWSTVRRRLAERAFQAAGVYEASSGEDDVAVDDAIRRFQATVDQIRDIEESMKEYLIIMGAFVETQQRLAVAFNRSFANGPLTNVSSQYVATQQRALQDFAHTKAIYLEYVLHPTNELMRKSMPEIHELLDKRGTLKLDYDSYSRRANAEIAKDANSIPAGKLVKKRDNAFQKLTEVTQQIRERLDDLEQRRPLMLVSEFSALLGIQYNFANGQSEVLCEMLPAVPHSAVSLCALAHATNSNAAASEVDAP